MRGHDFFERSARAGGRTIAPADAESVREERGGGGRALTNSIPCTRILCGTRATRALVLFAVR